MNTAPSFEEIKEIIDRLCQRMEQDNFQPTVIVALARGGWAPARLLASRLRIKRLMSFGLAYSTSDRTEISIYQDIIPKPKEEKILLVEDCLESGKSIKFVADHLSTQSLKNEVKTFALYVSRQSILKPDYYHEIVNEIPAMPWE
jgi:hypothetical protein